MDIAEQYLAEQLKGPKTTIQVVKIATNFDQLSLPKIDKMEIEEEQPQEQPKEEKESPPLEMDRIQ